MNTQQLRQKVLDLAIHGRLVAQDPNEEPASALLERIKAEKERLVKEKKIKKSKANTEPIDAPFEIPEGWEWCRVSSVICKIEAGKSIRCDETEPYGDQIGIVKTGVTSYGYFKENESKTCLSIDDWHDEYAIHEGDFLIARANIERLVGSCVIVDKITKKLMLSDKILRLVTIQIDPYYLLYTLKSRYLRFQIESSSTGTSATMKNISQGSIENLQIPLPPLEEQKRIVAEIEKWMHLIDIIEENQNGLNDNIEKAKAKILDLAVHGKLVEQNANEEPASALLERIKAEKERLVKEKIIKKSKVTYEDTPPIEIPKNWVWTKIGEISFCTKLAGFEYSKYISNNLQEKGVPLFKGKNVQNGEIIYKFESYIPSEISNELYRSQITKKCLLTPYVGTIGNIGIHNRDGIYHLGSNVGKVEFFNEPQITVLEEYAKAYLQSYVGNRQLTKHMKATAQASISIEAIRDVYIPLPPIEEQKRIVAKIEQLFAALDKMKQML